MTRRRVLLWGAGGVLAAAVAGIAIGEMAGWPFLRGPLQDAMARSARVPVTLDGPFSARLLWQPRLQVGHLVVRAANGLPVPHLLDATDVAITWRWGDLWRWRQGQPLRIQSLRSKGLDVNLVRATDGRASWQLGETRPADRDIDHAAPMGDVPTFGRLQIEAGRIAVDDAPLQTRLVAELRGGEGDALPDGTRGGYRATITGRYRALPLKLQADSGGMLPLVQDDDGTVDTTVPLRVQGEVGASTVLFDGRAGALMGDRRLMGGVRLRGPSLAQVGDPLGLTLPQSPPFDLAGQLDHAGGVWRLQAHRFAVGRSMLNGDFRFDTRPRPGKLTGSLSGPRLVLADLAPAIGKAGPAPVGAGRVLPQRRFDLPSLKAMNADVRVAIDELDFGSESLTPLHGLRGHVLLDGGVLHLRDLKAGVAGGQFSGTTSLDANAEPARWQLDLGFDTIDVAGWIRGVRTPDGDAAAKGRRANTTAALKRERQQARRGGEQPVNAYLTGMLQGRFKATGQGRSTAEILSTLTGESQISLRDGTLSYLVTELLGLDVAQALGVMITGDKPLPLRCARFDLAVNDGVVKPRVAVLDNADSTVRIQGQVDLRNEALALRAVARPKDFSPLSLRSPITVGGTLSSPVVGVDGGKIAGKVLGAVALGTVLAPAAALLALVDPGDDPAGDPCAAKPAPARPAASQPQATPRNDAKPAQRAPAR